MRIPFTAVMAVATAWGGSALAQDGLEATLDHPEVFYADEALAFGLKLKNVTDHELSFAFVDGVSGTMIGEMNWVIEDAGTGKTWKVGRNPNPGPAPLAPVRMGRKTLRPGESFDVKLRVLGWGKRFWQGEKEADPERTAAKLPAGKYVASLSMEVKADGRGGWKGILTLKSKEFEVSAMRRPVPEKVRKTREQVIALARERMVANWKRLKDAGKAECLALEHADLDAAVPEVDERIQKGIDEGQKLYQITFLIPCEKLGGKVMFAWSYDEFGRERSMTGVRLIKGDLR